MKLKKTILKVGQQGVIEVNLPVLTFGEGKPKVGIVSGLHGRETSGLFVILELLKSLKIKKGQLSILPVANPFGILFQSRNEPLEGKDLNRQFPGGQKDFSALLTKAIFDYFKDFDLVIDLHTFSRQTPSLVVWPKTGKKVDKLSLKIIESFAPEVIWQIDKNDSEFQGALDSSLAEQDISSFAIEMPQKISQEEISKITERIKNILVFLGMTDGKLETKKKFLICKIKTIFSPTSGIFIPQIKPLSKIRKNQKIGSIADISSFKETPFLSPESGVLITILDKGFVRLGTKIASIGQPI